MTNNNVNIVGSLANKPSPKTGLGGGLIVAGIIAAVVGLIMRLVARSQVSRARSVDIITDPTEAYAAAATLANVGLAFLIIGGALAFLGALAYIIRR